MRRLVAGGAGALLLIARAAPVFADYRTGLDAYKLGDYVTAFVHWRDAAHGGNPKAQFGLSMLYAGGEGVPENPAEAVRWCRLAAEQGLSEAQLNLGALYAAGAGVPNDRATALLWYERAAEQGHTEAQFAFGLALCAGDGPDRDEARAYAWLSLAAARGHVTARRARDRLADRLSGAEVAAADRWVKAWRPKRTKMTLAKGRTAKGTSRRYYAPRQH